MVEILAKQLADECRERGMNFFIAIEENGTIYSQHSVKDETAIRDLIKLLR